MLSTIGFSHLIQDNFDVLATRKSPLAIQHCFRRREKITMFSAIRLKCHWTKLFLPNARKVTSCPALTLGVIIVELLLFRMTNEKEKRKDNIKTTFALTPSHYTKSRQGFYNMCVKDRLSFILKSCKDAELTEQLVQTILILQHMQ